MASRSSEIPEPAASKAAIGSTLAGFVVVQFKVLGRTDGNEGFMNSASIKTSYEKINP